jgi:hypothetical protein
MKTSKQQIIFSDSNELATGSLCFAVHGLPLSLLLLP